MRPTRQLSAGVITSISDSLVEKTNPFVIIDDESDIVTGKIRHIALSILEKCRHCVNYEFNLNLKDKAIGIVCSIVFYTKKLIGKKYTVRSREEFYTESKTLIVSKSEASYTYLL